MDKTSYHITILYFKTELNTCFLLERKQIEKNAYLLSIKLNKLWHLHPFEFKHKSIIKKKAKEI